MSVEKKNTSGNFLVRAEFLTARPPASGDHYTPQLRVNNYITYYTMFHCSKKDTRESVEF